MIYLLDKDEDIVGVLDNSTPFACPYFNDLHVENVETGVHTYVFDMPANHSMTEKVVADGYVIFPDLDNRLQMFQIKEIEENSDDSSITKSVYCEHLAVPQLLGQILRPATFKQKAMDDILAVLLQGTGWSLGKVDYEGMRTITFDDHISILDAIFQVIDSFDAEIEYEVYFKNGQLVDKKIHVTNKRGRVTDKLFSYGKDLKEVKRTVNSEGLVTALIGVGPGNSGGSRMTLAGSTYADLPDGYESPYSADFVESEEALKTYGSNGKHIMGVYVADKVKTRDELYVKTVAELKRREKPKTTYDMAVALLERVSGYSADEVRVGDTIRVDDTTFNPRLAVQARVIEMRRSYTDPEQDGVVLGDYRKLKISDYPSLDKIAKKISQNEEKWNSSTIKVEVLSSKGLMFRNGEYSTELQAKVYDGKTEITDLVDEARFIWTRQSKDFADDLLWNQRYAGGRKKITVTNQEIYARATFLCSISDEY